MIFKISKEIKDNDNRQGIHASDPEISDKDKKEASDNYGRSKQLNNLPAYKFILNKISILLLNM